MAWFALGVALLLGFYMIGRWFTVADPRQLARALRILLVAVAGIGVLYLALSGRLAIATALIGGLLPLILRWKALGRLFRNVRGPSPGQQSRVETRFLRMSLDHDTGVIAGTVLDGPYRGRTLHELSRAELLDLLRQCRVEDPESATLLESYLDRTAGADWRETEGGGAAGGAGEAPARAAMTPEEAYRILGLEPGAGEAEIRRAHRELMKKLHPDRGGSTWLAAKINEAKDLLLRT